MQLSKKDIQYIITLAQCEKPEKKIKEYLEREFPDRDKLNKRISMFNKSYRSFFYSYFRKFAGHLVSECIAEAYATGLSCLENGADLETALYAGYRAGTKLHRQNKKEEQLIGGSYDTIRT